MFSKGEIDCARNVPAADIPKLKAETNDLTQFLNMRQLLFN